MGCEMIALSPEGMAEQKSVNCAFQLAVLEASLDIIARRLAEIPVAANADSFYCSETPIALEEAREALAALKQAHLAAPRKAG